MGVDIVAAVKASLDARGVDLTGACGAFAITQRVAWALKDQGIGLLDKPGGNNCGGYATDMLVLPDGGLVDILGDGGGANTPMWQVTGEVRLISQWRDPIEPEDLADGDAPTIDLPAETPPTSSDRALEAFALTLRAILQRLDAQDADAAAFRTYVEQLARTIKAPVYQGTLTGRNLIVLKPVTTP